MQVTLLEINQNLIIPLWLDLRKFATIKSNFNYFDHSHNYDPTIENILIH
jgi:hypothetical protein